MNITRHDALWYIVAFIVCGLVVAGLLNDGTWFFNR